MGNGTGRRAERWATLAVVCVALMTLGAKAPAAMRQPSVEGRSKPVLAVAGLRFRDLDANGRLDPYEDWRLPAARRADDLVRRMTLDEKAGAVMHGTAPTLAAPANGYDTAKAAVIVNRGVGALISRLSGDYGVMAEENNRLQALAESTRLGVPLLVSTDPRNHFSATLGASVASGGFSKWPETLGLAAIGDEALVRRFADVARQEYRAVGLQQALSPQADLATEPRWARIGGTFGEDSALTARMVKAYVRGFQGGPSGVTRDGVITVVKHWAGYGAAKDGWDSHNSYGQSAAFPGDGFANHLKPFEAAFSAGVADVMPTYSIVEGPVVAGRPLEPVGAGYSGQLLTDLLRGHYGFKGVIVSDWGITADCRQACRGGARPGAPPAIGMPWGVEGLTPPERFARAALAGVDQFGGVDDPQPLIEAVRSGALPESRLDDSVRRLLIQKFDLGLFENPYVDVTAARTLATKGFQGEADRAQSRSLVVLENRDRLLPLAPGRKVYLRGVAAAAATARGLQVVDAPEKADVAIVRVAAPFHSSHEAYFFGRRQHEGDLDFKDGDPDYEAIQVIAAKVPTVVTVYLDRPAILTNVRGKVAALIGDFGVADGPLLDALLGRVAPEGRLPFELPSSMAEVAAQKPDLPHDTAKPLYPFAYRFGR